MGPPRPSPRVSRARSRLGQGRQPSPGPPPRDRARVFLSYGQRDAQAIAERLRHSLDARFDVWQDKRRIRLARRWDEEIEAALRQSSVVVFLLTPHAVRESRTSPDGKDSVCRDELAYAREHDVPILPVRISPCDTPLLIHRLQQLDFTQWGESDASYEVGVGRIVGAIEAVLRGETVPERDWHGLPSPFDFEPLVRTKLIGFTGRQWLFDEIEAWLGARRGNALLIVGDPGAGKSAAAAALVRDNPSGRVLGYHFCDYSTPETTDPAVFVRSLVAQLCARLDGFQPMVADPEIGRVLAKVDADPASVFETVVLGGLGRLSPPPDGVRFILVDALDEALTWNRRPTIVDVLSARIERLPGWLKLVVTTRRDPPVQERLRGFRTLSVDAQDPRGRDDLRRFIEERLRDPAMRPQVSASKRTLKATASRLLAASEDNFLAAAMALEAVRLNLITLAEAEGLSPGLEARYQLFFERMFPDPRSDYGMARQLLEVVVAAQEPLQRLELQAASELTEEATEDILRRMSPFVPGRGGRFKVVHKTVGDWLTSASDGLARAGEYAASLTRGRKRLADWCWAQYQRGSETASGYCLRHLATHLSQLGRTAELRRVLFDIEWLRARAAAVDASLLVADCGLLTSEATRRLGICLRAAAVAEDELAPALAEQMLARLPAEGIPELEALREQAALSLRTTAFRSRFATMTLTGLLASLEKSPTDLARVALSEDGRSIHGMSSDGAQHRWDARSGRAVADPPGGAVPRSPVPRSPRRRTRASLRRHIEYLAGFGDSELMLSNGDDSRVIAAWGDGTLGAYDARDPDRIRTTKAHSVVAAFLQFLDEDRFASHARPYHHLQPYGDTRVWDFATLGSLPQWATHLDWIRSIAFSPDGRRAATVSTDRDMHLWDQHSGLTERVVNVTFNSVGGVAFSPDGRWILTGDRQHCLKLWDRDVGTVRAWIPQRAPRDRPGADLTDREDVFCINAVEFTNDPARAVIAADGLSLVDVGEAVAQLASVPAEEFDPRDWDALGHCVCSPFEEVRTELFALGIAPDGSLALGGGGPMRGVTPPDAANLWVWDLRTLELLFPLVGHTGGVTGIAMAEGADSMRAVSSSADATVISWDLATRRPRHVLRGHVGRVRAVTVAPDGRHAVSAGSDRTLRLWDLRSGAELSRFTGDEGFSACRFSVDGRYLVAGDMVGRVHFFEPLLPD